MMSRKERDKVNRFAKQHLNRTDFYINRLEESEHPRGQEKNFNSVCTSVERTARAARPPKGGQNDPSANKTYTDVLEKAEARLKKAAVTYFSKTLPEGKQGEAARIVEVIDAYSKKPDSMEREKAERRLARYILQDKDAPHPVDSDLTKLIGDKEISEAPRFAEDAYCLMATMMYTQETFAKLEAEREQHEAEKAMRGPSFSDIVAKKISFDR